MRRIINFRPFLLTAIFSILAVAMAIVYCSFSTLLGIILGVILSLIPIIFAIIYRKNTIKVVSFVLCFIVSIGTFFSTTGYVTSRNTVNYYEQEVEILGVVSEVVSHDENHSVVLDNLQIDGDKVGGKLCVRFSKEDKETKYFLNGDIISFIAQPITTTVSIEEGFSYGDVRYYAYTSINSVQVSIGQTSLRDKILYSLRKGYNEWLGEYGEIAYGIVTGDKGGIPNEFRNSYTISGIGHILAVSGLHIGFLMGVVLFVLRLLRVKQKVRPWICFCILLLYNLLVGFSFSIIRATIMFVVSYLAKLSGKENDRLNNLMLSTTIILCIFPLSIFDAGFLMSFGCMLSIVLFSDDFANGFIKIFGKRAEKFSSSLAVSVCAQLGVFPVLTYYFSSISIYSILSNLILLPLLNLIFVLVLSIGLLLLIFPFMGYVLWVLKYIFKGLDFFNYLVGLLPLSQIILYGTTFVFLLFPLYFLSSRYINFPKKWIAVLLSCIVCISAIFIDNIGFLSNNHICYTHAAYDVTTLVKTNDKNIVIGDFSAYSRIEESIVDARAHKIDSIYITYLTQSNAQFVCEFVEKYNVQSVYIREQADSMAVFTLVNNGIIPYFISSQTEVCEVIDNGEFIGYQYDKMLFTSYKTKLDKVDKLYLSTLDIVRAYTTTDTSDIKWALNFTKENEQESISAFDDTLIIDYKTLNFERI